VAMFTSSPKGGGPSSISEADVRRYPEKSRLFSALIWVLELNRKIFSSHKQALSERMRWPAVPLFIDKSNTWRSFKDSF